MENVHHRDSIREEAESPLDARSATETDVGVRTIHLVIGAAAIGLIFWYLQFSTQAICCGDLDGYYHIKWSQMLWEGMRSGHFPPTFKWLPLTTLNPKDYVDHHFLFHILQIPFTWFSDVRMGAKISAMLFASLAVFSCYWLIIRYRIKYAPVWLIALLGCSAPFLFRMNMTKAMGLSIIFLITGIHLLFQRKYLWLLPLAFVFTLTYDMFALLGTAAVIRASVLFWSERRIEWRPVLWVAVGVIAGFILNPYFPRNIRLFYEHLMMKVTPSNFSTSVGQEWYPYDSWAFLGNCFVAFVAMVIGYIAFDWTDKKRAQVPLFFLIFSTLLLIANARWRRFSEYWPPFAILFAAFSLQQIFDGVRSITGRLPADVLSELQPFLDRHERAETVESKRRKEQWKTIAATVIALVLCVPLYLNIQAEVREIGDTAPHEDYRGGMEWIHANVPPGQMIFNTDWDDFPKMFFYDTTHTYVSGLDPTYLLDKNPELAKLYESITLGKEKDPAPIIRDRFGARYVFTDNEEVHADFYASAMDSGWFEEAYADEHCTVLHILDQYREPPPVDTDENNDEQGNGNQDDEEP